MKPATERLPAGLEPLRQECITLDRQLSARVDNHSGICIADQERYTDLLRKWQGLTNQYILLAREAGATEIYLNDLRG